MKPRRLTIKQQKFIKEYIQNDGNGTQAALKVYDTEVPKVAEAIATENLSKPSIREKVDEALATLEITPEWVLNKHKRLVDTTIENPGSTGMVTERALENIGKIANLYPSATNSLEIGDGHLKLSWGGSDIPTD